jgi:hypothetical protein
LEDPADLAMAEEFLGDASEQVRLEANKPGWTIDNVPAAAANIALAAAARAYNNPEGYDRERFDASDIERHADAAPAAVVLTQGEVRTLRKLGRIATVQSVPMTNPDRFVARSDQPRHGGRFYGHVLRTGGTVGVYDPLNPFSADAG